MYMCMMCRERELICSLNPATYRATELPGRPATRRALSGSRDDQSPVFFRVVALLENCRERWSDGSLYPRKLYHHTTTLQYVYLAS
jgi:hypothetical protein